MISTLEKVRRLEKYLAANYSSVDPVIDAAIDKLIAREHARLLKLKKRLLDQCKAFEKKYSLKSAVFILAMKKEKWTTKWIL